MEIPYMIPEHINVTITGLAQNIGTFRGLLEEVPEGLIHWRPAEGKWNLLEVVCHLADEEVEDFRARVSTTLITPESEPPSIDPEGWVTSREYDCRDYPEVVSIFLKERSDSVEWLRSLGEVNWDNAFTHRIYGPMKARMFLANWLAHDYLHIRQIVRMKYHFHMEVSKEFLRYAGEW